MEQSGNRVEALIVARAFALRGAVSLNELLEPLDRFGPPELTRSAWRETLESACDRLSGDVLEANRLRDREELRRRIGAHHAKSWLQLSDRILPALGLGVAADDQKAHARLSSRDVWAAAVVARMQGLWRDGPPPSLAFLCDALAWHRLGLAGRPKRLPPEVRSLFLARELAIEMAPHDRLVRQIAARELGVPRADARAFREGLVRRWLAGRELRPKTEDTFAEKVIAVARQSKQGVFGDRKVFISEVWRELRRDPAWTAVSLDEFKRQLLAAQHAGHLELARADLVAAMNPEHVSASETVSNGASFHFIVRETA